MLDFTRPSLGLGGRYMICLVWICLNLVYQLECLLYDIRRPCAFVFHFSIFFKNFMHIWFWSNPRFNQDLNKFQAWKWKRKPRSFLISHSKIYEAFGTYLKFPCLKPKTNSLHDWLHKTEFRVRGRYTHDFSGLNMSRPCLSTWVFTIWHN